MPSLTVTFSKTTGALEMIWKIRKSLSVELREMVAVVMLPVCDSIITSLPTA